MSLQTKISLFVALGLLALFSLLGFFGVRALGESTQRTLAERLVIAQMAAQSMDQILRQTTSQVERFALSEPIDLEDGNLEPEKGTLRSLYYYLGLFTNSVFLLDKRGTVLWTEPYEPATVGKEMSDYPVVERALRLGRSQVSSPPSLSPAQNPTALLATPIRSNRAEVTGALVVNINLAPEGLAGFIQPGKLGRTAYADIVSEEGQVMATTRPDIVLDEMEKAKHAERFAALIQEGKATVRTCHSCHETRAGAARRRDVLAFAPLSTAPWGVAIREAEEEALAPTRNLERTFLLVGGLALALILPFTWLGTRRIVKPVKALTLASQEIAQGDFDSAITPQGGGEIETLARSFETMRVKLKMLYEEVQRKEQVRGQLLERVIAAQEEERRRIGRELHDEAGQSLTALMMGLGVVEQSLSSEGTEQVKERLEVVKKLASQTIEEIDRLISDLRPTLLDDMGLLPAVRWYTQSYSERLGIKVKLQASGLGKGRLPGKVETALFRIIQEALTNVAKHAEAKSVNVRLDFKDARVTLLVEDDGKGFDLGDSRSKGLSLGLVGMEERASLLGGTFSISSKIGQGTRILVEVPVERVNG